MRRRVELPDRGVTLATLDFGGEGPLALLAHASGFCAGLYALIAPALCEEFRVIAFDARGHGDSSKPPLDAYNWEEFIQDAIALSASLCADLDLPRVDYAIGHSFGGTALLAAAAGRPDLFGRIAMLDPPIGPPADEWPDEVGEHPNVMADIARARRHVWSSRAELRKAWEGREPFASWTSRALDLYVAEGFRDRDDGQIEIKCPGEVEAAVYEASPRFDIFERAKWLRAPGLLLHAGIGHLPRELHERLAASLPTLEFQAIPADHLMLMTAPDEIAQRLLAFSASTPLEPANTAMPRVKRA